MKRMETLKNNGFDTSKYFTLMVEKDIPAGTKINIEVDTTNDSIAQQIIEDGYVRNTKLHRRFVAAQYMRMLESPLGWHGYLNVCYDYMYQFDMMIEEIRVLSKLENKDRETFLERRMFFTHTVVEKVLEDYIDDVTKYLTTLKIRHCDKKPYIYIPGFGCVYTDEVEQKVINPMEALLELCKRTYLYKNLYETLKIFKRTMIKLPYHTRKSKTWVNAFQRAGAYYTLKNLIMFHDVKIYAKGVRQNQNESMYLLKNVAAVYEGYQLNGLLKETIKLNNFNFKKSIEAHK